ncbi:MAG: tRNA (N(6)-L-threonylcarbamoyladenosine(37)-C(2))-methylthiotransferase MtaB [Hyphomicrobiales bacterium]|nr:tRNA (N(6)-L-threonylcarbamoyladenosine(37)-C(2))-methylthiotransferase MtaB [Hyphomicrobiales bacterium]
MGCRLNAFEADVMRAHAGAAGLAGTIIVNTCAVTAEAVRQSRQTIRRLRRENPGARVVVTGCAAQIEPETFADMDEVDHIVGNREKLDPGTWRDIAAGSADRARVGDIMTLQEEAHHLASVSASRHRAFVQVQTGCDHRCTFCIIPYGRGPSRSVPAGHVVAQVRALVEAGVSEVAITGVDITSYGSDLPGRPTLGWLVRQILKHVPDLPRLRLSSIDQVETDPNLYRALAEEERLMPHLHLSLQAGDDLILKRMKRRHLRADAIAFCDRVRALRPDVEIGADLIAGFPTETEDMFRRSLDIVEECGLTFLHVFPFSPRKGTPAARMPQVAVPVVKERAARLRAAGERRLDQHLEGLHGRVLDVLVEDAKGGRARDFTEVAVSAPAGHIIATRVIGREGSRALGEVVA